MERSSYLSTLSASLLLLNLVATSAQAVSVGGQITVDTVWSNTSEAYTITSTVQIAPNVTLTIADGVSINGGQIQVFGSLDVNGSSNNRVQFNNTIISPGANSVSRSTPYAIDISYAQINGGQLYYPTGNAVYGSLQLTDSVLYDTPYMYLWYPVADSHIERNAFYNTGGISVGLSGGVNAYVLNNLFSGLTTGYAVENWAGYNGSQTIAQFNSFLDVGNIALNLPDGYSSASMIGTQNWWGTADVATIEAMIHDRSDSFSVADYIDYSGYLSAPHPLTPTTVPIPPALWLFGSGLLGLIGVSRRRLS